MRYEWKEVVDVFFLGRDLLDFRGLKVVGSSVE